MGAPWGLRGCGLQALSCSRPQTQRLAAGRPGFSLDLQPRLPVGSMSVCVFIYSLTIGSFQDVNKFVNYSH